MPDRPPRLALCRTPHWTGAARAKVLEAARSDEGCRRRDRRVRIAAGLQRHFRDPSVGTVLSRAAQAMPLNCTGTRRC